jgi:hypothetical protein
MSRERLRQDAMLLNDRHWQTRLSSRLTHRGKQSPSGVRRRVIFGPFECGLAPPGQHSWRFRRGNLCRRNAFKREPIGQALLEPAAKAGRKRYAGIPQRQRVLLL